MSAHDTADRRLARRAQAWGQESAELQRARLLAAIDRTTLDLINEARAAQRRELYSSDPLWRLSKLKDSRERRLRAKLQRERQAAAELERQAWRQAQAARRRQRAPYRARSTPIGRAALRRAAAEIKSTPNRQGDCRATARPLAIVSSLSDSTESANHCRRFRARAFELADLTHKGETLRMRTTLKTSSIEGAR